MTVGARIAILNPNTTAAFTERLAALGRRLAAPDTIILARSPLHGVASVECHVDEAVATLGLLGVVAEEEAFGTNAYVLACFGDTGIEAVREIAAGPVVGMTEAALSAASIVADHFCIVTLPPRTVIHAERVVRRLGLAYRCRVRAIDVAVDDCVALDRSLLDAMIAESRRGLEQDGAAAVILGCAGLSELVAPMREALGVPVIEGVGIALKLAEGLVANGVATSKRGAYAAPPRGWPPA